MCRQRQTYLPANAKELRVALPYVLGDTLPGYVLTRLIAGQCRHFHAWLVARPVVLTSKIALLINIFMRTLGNLSVSLRRTLSVATLARRPGAGFCPAASGARAHRSPEIGSAGRPVDPTHGAGRRVGLGRQKPWLVRWSEEGSAACSGSKRKHEGQRERAASRRRLVFLQRKRKDRLADAVALRHLRGRAEGPL